MIDFETGKQNKYQQLDGEPESFYSPKKKSKFNDFLLVHDVLFGQM